MRRVVACAGMLAALHGGSAWPQTPSERRIDGPVRVGSTIDLDGPFAFLGNELWRGLRAAFESASLDGHPIEIIGRNDSYDPERTARLTAELIDDGIVAMVGSLGTPTAAASLPLLAEANVPAVGFFTGGSLLRQGQPFVVNLRSSYRREIVFIVASAATNGVHARHFCAVTTTDGVGASVLDGITDALREQAPGSKALQAVTTLAKTFPNRADGKHYPVALGGRGAMDVVKRYRQIVAWEQATGVPCKMILIDGNYQFVSRFVQLARFRDRDWIFATLSYVASDALTAALQIRNFTDRVLVSAVLPEVDEDVPIFAEAREVLGRDFSDSALEGFLAGRLTLKMIREARGSLSGDALLETVLGKRVSLGGLELDFTDDGDGLADPRLRQLTPRGWVPMDDTTWQRWR